MAQAKKVGDVVVTSLQLEIMQALKEVKRSEVRFVTTIRVWILRKRRAEGTNRFAHVTPHEFKSAVDKLRAERLVKSRPGVHPRIRMAVHTYALTHRGFAYLSAQMRHEEESRPAQNTPYGGA